MAVRVEISGRLLSSRITDNLEEQLEKKVEQSLKRAISNIRKRTKSGRDSSGHHFRRYTPGYAKFKASKGLPTSPVDLTFTGKMLNSLRGRMIRRPRSIAAEISVNDDERKVRGVQRLRRFLGFTQNDATEIFKILKDINLRAANR